MEWFHRNIGRLLGLVYTIPAIYFIYKGKIHKKNALKAVGLGSLIGAQGLVGWFMVSSGLNQELAEIPGAVPRVSQYRLTMHLGMAYLLYTMFFLYGSKTVKLNRLVNGKIKNIDKLREIINRPEVRKFEVGVKHLTKFGIVVCLSGGMVAGLDAGLVYNEFPLMGGRLLPPFEEYWSNIYAENIFGQVQGMWHNLFENPTTVQMVHRTMAMSMCFGVSYIWWVGRRLKLNLANRVMLNSVFFFMLTQVGLGIGTLVNYVPLAWASAHQANSVLLVASLLGLSNTLKKLPKVV
ncbi:hypothetical protein BB561_002605 [Smittium simulii]|uniref:Cytochrome c oxidase assembly protein COX15 n=1 Tax=Smittium simulii TaxID=133385 RepID=A0A2T9YQ17_9FUNG|nr:hypothetical protein BB561_002605 [Smittium simulii]